MTADICVTRGWHVKQSVHMGHLPQVKIKILSDGWNSLRGRSKSVVKGFEAREKRRPVTSEQQHGDD